MINRRRFLKTSAIAAAGSMLATSELMAAASVKSKIERTGLQLFSIPKLLENDFAGTIKMLAQTGYKEVEFFGPYPFSTPEDQAAWETVTPSLGFKGSGYFGHSAKETKDILDSSGITSPAMHVGLGTLRKKLDETAEAAHTLGQQYAGIAAIPPEERRTLDDYKRMADEFNDIGAKAQKLGLHFYYHNHGYGLKRWKEKFRLILFLRAQTPRWFFLKWIFTGQQRVALILWNISMQIPGATN
jgi:hypothetical protein